MPRVPAKITSKRTSSSPRRICDYPNVKEAYVSKHLHMFLFLNLQKPFQEPSLASVHIVASPYVECVPRLTWLELYTVCRTQDATVQCQRVVLFVVHTPHLPRIPTGKKTTGWMSRHSGVQSRDPTRPIHRPRKRLWFMDVPGCVPRLPVLIMNTRRTVINENLIRAQCPIWPVSVFPLCRVTRVCCSGIFRMILTWFLPATPITGYFCYYYY